MGYSVLDADNNETDCQQANPNLLFVLNAGATVQQGETSSRDVSLVLN